MYEYYNDGNGCFKVEVVEDRLFAHVSITKWSKSIFVKYVDVWEQFKQHALNNGYEYIYSIIPKDNKILKFNLMFGATIVYEEENTLVLQFSLRK